MTTIKSLLSLSLIGALILLGLGGVAAQEPVDFTIFLDQDSLTIYIPGDQPVSLQDFTFEVLVSGERVTRRLDEYAEFAGLYFNNVLTPTCFRLERDRTTSALPQVCQQLPRSQLLIQRLAGADVFWYDTALEQERLVLVTQGEMPLGQCPFQAQQCELRYIPPTVTPTSTIAPTDTPTKTLAATLTATPSPMASYTPTLTFTPTMEPTPTPEFLPAGVEPDWTPEYAEFNGVSFVYVPAGCFMMGSTDEQVQAAFELCEADRGEGECSRGWYENELPQHEVCLDGFWISETEVTNDQYRACVDAGECTAPVCNYFDDPAYANHPVVCIDWQQADAYVRWSGGSLPTEAQWEYAARGPASRVYPWGNVFDGSRLNFCDVNCEFDWHDVNWDDRYKDIAPVGSYTSGASWVGALDMAGNAGEWMNDWYGPYSAESQINPIGLAEGDARVLRGGAFLSVERFVRAAYRARLSPSVINRFGGFRCVRPHSSD